MPDNQSKRRRGLSTSKHKLTNVAPQGERNDPTQGASLSRANLERIPETTWGSSSTMIGQQNPEGKMLLIPLARPMAAISRASERNRTTHACDLCRKAKAKCTGGQPCQECKNKGKECVYGDGKRDKERKIWERTTKQNESLRADNETLRDGLRKVGESPNLTELEHSEISELLAKVSFVHPRSQQAINPSKSPTVFSADDDEYVSVSSQPYQVSQLHGENDAGGDVGSTGSLDAIDVDTNRDMEAQSTGFLGKSSEVKWSQRAEKEVYDDDAELMRTELASYHTGDPDFYKIIRQEVSPSWKYELPAHETAMNLINTYFTHVHQDFPILNKDDFMQKFQQCSENREKKFAANDHLVLCQINCVFAISSTFENLVATERNESDHRDHLIYYARVRALGLEQQPYGAVASLEYITPLGLLGLYLAANYYVNRAWNMIGIAVRNALALGLHIRNEAPKLSDTDKDLRNRIWWSIFSLEHLMNEITGRPSCINYCDISAPHPVSFKNEVIERTSPQRPNIKGRRSGEIDKGKGKATEVQRSRQILGISKLARAPLYTSSSTTTYLSHRIALNVITHEILNRLFCAAVVDMKWNKVQDIIRDIDSRLLQYKSSLPNELAFPFGGIQEEDDNWRERRGLAMTYHTARMILHRPALCRMDGRIQNESSVSQQFNRDAVTNCIESARGSLAAIGPPDDPTKIYFIQPWWEILHHVSQAASILMLEIAYRASHIPDEAAEILQDAKNAVHWLRVMSRQSIPARKAWQAHDRTLRFVATKIDADMSDMLTEAEVPPGWGSSSSRNPAIISFEEENIPGHSLTEHQAQNLAATSAWVQSATAHPETGQSYTGAEYPDLPISFQPGFQSNFWGDPYNSYDSPGFPWQVPTPYFLDQPQEMQGVISYQYGSGLNLQVVGIGSQIQQDISRSSGLQNQDMTRTGEHTYQDVQDPFDMEGNYNQQIELDSVPSSGISKRRHSFVRAVDSLVSFNEFDDERDDIDGADREFW